MSAAKIAVFCMLGATLAGMGLARSSKARGPEAGMRAELASDQADLADRSGKAQATGRDYIVTAGRDHQFHADLEADGQHVAAMIDTGASHVVLPAEAAARFGFFPAPSDFTVPVGTANGTSLAAPVVIHDLHVGPLAARQVQALVMQPGALNVALLGMTFLGRLSGYSVEGQRLILRQ